MTKRQAVMGNCEDKQQRNLQDNQKESQRRYQETQPKGHSRKDHGIKYPEESK